MKRALKVILSVAISIALVMSLFTGTLAATTSKNLSIEKGEYLANDNIKVTVTGLTDEQIQEQGAWVGLFVKGYLTSKGSYDGISANVNDLKDGKTWEFKAPNELGEYEIRLVVNSGEKDMDLDFVGFKVGTAKAKSGDVKINKSTFLPNDQISVTIKGLTQGQIENSAWAGLFLKGDKVEASSYNGLYSYISDLKDGKTWSFKAPTEFGLYEIRVFSADPSSEQRAAVLFETVSLEVAGNKAKSENVKINKQSFLPNDEVAITVKGLTQGQIDDNAWVGLFLKGDKIEAGSYNGEYAYISSLKSNDTWTFKAPTEFGYYELRVFSADPSKELRAAALYATVPFQVKGNLAKPGDLKINKTEFKKGEPIYVTITGLTPGQIEDNAWAGLYLPKDENKTSPYNGIDTYVSALRDGKTWTFNAPSEPGFYEIRVFSKDASAEKRDPAFFGKLSFKVITIDQAAGYSFTFKPTEVSLKKGASLKLEIKATPLTGGRQIPANNMVTYTSRNTKVATVTKEGIIKVIGYDDENSTGTTYIDVKYGKTLIKSIKVSLKV